MIKKFDLVKVDKDYSAISKICKGIEKKTKSDFAGKTAVVIDDSEFGYGLYFKNEGKVWPFPEAALKLIKHNQKNLLHQWENKAEEKKKIHSNLDWIFKNGEKILKEYHGHSMRALWNCIERSAPWGVSGEGYRYFLNIKTILKLARPFLLKHDKEGWLKFCEQHKNE